MWVRGAIGVLALPPVVIAVVQLGRLHPDEVFQMLQPAHRFAFGHGELPWEWHKGLRNWLVPGVLGCFLKLAAALGIDDPIARRAVLAIPQYALHALSLAALYRVLRRRLDPALPHLEAWSLAGVALLALYAPVLHFAGRTLTESFSASLLLWGFERADLREPRPRAHALGGFLIGLAVIARYGSIVFAFGALLYLLAARRFRPAAHLALGGALAAAVLAALDLHSFGKPFHSLLAYAEFNVFSDASGDTFGRSPWWFLLQWTARALPAWAWLALALAGYRTLQQRSWSASGVSGLPFVCALLYLVVVSIPSHKEERFLYPALVLLLAALAPAWIRELSALARPIAQGLLALSLASSLALLASSTRFTPRATQPFRLFVKGVQTGRGVVLTHAGLWGSPGDFYAAGRPWLLCGRPDDGCTQRALRSKRFDRVVAYEDEGKAALEKRGFSIIDSQGKYRLWARGPRR